MLADGLSWRDEVFAFTREPAVLVVSEAAFTGLAIPTNRESLINLLRARADIFAVSSPDGSGHMMYARPVWAICSQPKTAATPKPFGSWWKSWGGLMRSFIVVRAT